MSIANRTDCNYRVLVKAVIRNSMGQILLNRETGHSNFSLPGGGIEYGENIMEAFTRELYEEVGLTADFLLKPLCTIPVYGENRDRWLLWSVYEVTTLDATFRPGNDSDEITWLHPSEIDNTTRAGKLIHEALTFLS